MTVTDIVSETGYKFEYDSQSNEVKILDLMLEKQLALAVLKSLQRNIFKHLNLTPIISISYITGTKEFHLKDRYRCMVAHQAPNIEAIGQQRP